MSDKHVFLSYLREDKENVDELEQVLIAAGFATWRDTNELWAGDNWQLKIRQAIKGGSIVFLGCFSTKLASRETSYQHAELLIAAEEYRLRPMDTNWLMTVRFDECEIPPLDLGGGRSLDETINRMDLFGTEKMPQIARLVTSIHRVMNTTPGVPSAAVLEAVSESKRAEGSLEALRDLIRNPTLVMDYDEHMASLRRPLLTALADRDRFSMDGQGGSLTAADILAWVARIGDYEKVIADMLEPVKLISMYGHPSHEEAVSQTMRALGNECLQSTGLDFWTTAHQYPAVTLTYVAAVSATIKRNYGMLRAAIVDATVVEHNVGAPFIARSGAGSVAGNWQSAASLLCLMDDGQEPTLELAQDLLDRKIGKRFTPVSDHLYSLLAPLYRDLIGSDADYADVFDRAEILLDAIAADAKLSIEGIWGGYGGYGRYTWRHKHSSNPPEAVMRGEAEAAGAGWTPLLNGLFGGSSERAIAALDAVSDYASHLRKNQRFA